MAGHNKNIYRIIAIHEFADTLKEGEQFHLRQCVTFLNTRKAIGSNRPNKQTQTDRRQLAMLLRKVGMFTNIGHGIWEFDGIPIRRKEQ
ncbi:MAG: hypothetical protein GOVbin1753_83 [Prokaryotic dsDNA virus sp.]|nr:MAG: hypothetical protein GOVbin1753_83 [Prokaryotic dsDNA virus sp.]|tara:strand:- start:189 stop:455 length:267 start_codon:yes stop_codon:yes gene_type:complete